MCILFQLHTFSAVHISGAYFVCAPFFIPRRAGIKCTPKAGQFPDIKCISLPSSFLPSFLYLFLISPKSAYTSWTPRQQAGKRKSAYTRRTPEEHHPPPKNAYTRQPRVLYKKYAYKAAADCEKVHTLG